MSESGKRNILNKLVRAEMPGANPILDGLNLFDKICFRTDPNSEVGKIVRLALDKFDEAAREMREKAQQLRIERRTGPPTPH